MALQAPFQLGELAGKLFIGGEQAPQADEGAHDRDIDLHRPAAAQH